MKYTTLLLAALLGIGFHAAASETAIPVKNSEFKIENNRIAGWGVACESFKQAVGPEGKNALQISFRKLKENAYQACPLFDPPFLKPGKYRYSLAVQLKSDEIHTIQFYNPVWMADKSKVPARYVAIKRSEFPEIGEWTTFSAEFTLPEGCGRTEFGLEFRSTVPADILIADPRLVRLDD